MLSLLTGWALGVVLGMRHALEPDHLAAVSTMVAERPTPRGAAVLGAVWGVGHTIALFVAGGLLLALRRTMPTGLADLFELVVAVMLLVLGARALRSAMTQMQGGHDALHQHHRGAHHHRGGPIAHLHLGRITVARRPLVIGLVHGLAGSGALTALVLASMPSTVSALVYLLLFGVGSLAGMALLTGIVGLSLRRFAVSARWQAALVAAAGSASVLLGVTGGVPLALKLFGR
jgi:hypothetical protein